MVSSSRRSVVKGIGAWLLGSMVGPGCRAEGDDPGDLPASPSPRLRLVPRGTTSEAPRPSLWLALSSLPDSTRTELLDDLESAISSVEARHHPLGLDLLEEDPEAVVARVRPWLLPICNAADALLSRRFPTPEGQCVEVSPPSPDDRNSFHAWSRPGESTDSTARRARFFAWAISQALVVDVNDERERTALVTRLRDATLRVDSTISLVVLPAVLRGESPDPRIDRLLQRVTKHAEARKRSRPPIELVVPKRNEALAPALSLDADDLLVVPKLKSAVHPERLLGELKAALAATGAAARIRNGPNAGAFPGKPSRA